MDNPNYTTEHRKGQHLLNEERYEIEVRLKDGWSIYKIAKHLGRAYNTIKDEVERASYETKIAKKLDIDVAILREKISFFTIIFSGLKRDCSSKYSLFLGIPSNSTMFS